MGAGLSLGTNMMRTLTVPGLSSIEKSLWEDWDNLKTEHPELGDIGDLLVQGSNEGGISKVWATEAKFSCYQVNGGKYGAEVLMLPIESEDGRRGANIMLYIYDLKSGQFIKEIARTYEL